MSLPPQFRNIRKPIARMNRIERKEYVRDIVHASLSTLRLNSDEAYMMNKALLDAIEKFNPTREEPIENNS